MKSKTMKITLAELLCRLGIGFALIAPLACGPSLESSHHEADDSSQLSGGVRDDFYQLELVPSNGYGKELKFVVCHLDRNQQVDMSAGRCSDAFNDSDHQPITIERQQVIDDIAALEDEESTRGDTLRQKKRVITYVGYGQAGMVGGGAVGSVVLIRRLSQALGPLVWGTAAVAGILTVGYFAVDSEKLEFLGIYRDGFKNMVKDIGSGAADIGAGALVAGAKLITGTSKVLSEAESSGGSGRGQEAEGKGPFSSGERTTSHFKANIYGEASRTLASRFDDIVDLDSPVSKPILARVPDVLPLLGSFLENIGWVEKGKVAYHCLPRHRGSDESGLARAHCLPFKQNWHTGGAIRYTKPTQGDEG